jgi:uncharacterized secreted protein with C-terminal beta-propeller domain
MRKMLFLVLALGLVTAACTDASDSADEAPTTTVTMPFGGAADLPPLRAVPAALIEFDACDDLLSHIKAEARDQVGPWGLDGYGYGYFLGDDVVFEEDVVASEAPVARGADAAAPEASQESSYSTTNVQERGVDEPDIVKTDGSRIIVLSGGSLRYVDITDETPELRGTLYFDRGWGHELLVSGDRAIVVSTGSRYSAVPEPGPDVWSEDLHRFPSIDVTRISEVDLSDPDELRVVRDLYIDGSYVSARLVGDTARLVMRSQPTGLEFTFPKGSGLRSEREAEEANRQVIDDSTIDNWLPFYVLEDLETGEESEGTLVDCGAVHAPPDFSGLGTTSVVTIDLSSGLRPGAAASVFAAGDTVYATLDSLYVATNPWVGDVFALAEDDREGLAGRMTTSIHKFDTSSPEAVVYLATGEVPGYLLNQWAMSEHDGNLRVASTDAGSVWGFAPEGGSESFLTVLAERGDDLATVGRVGDLGRGERIYAVRYVGDLGLVVTFRQVDPLYTIDLSDPENPQVRGELKIPGYSAYLHPVGEDLVLGIGQDADLDGRTEGSQVSLFDVSDLDDPVRVAKKTFRDGYSEVESDHRAFLHWAAEGVSFVPMQRWGYNEWTGEEEFFSGLVVFEIDEDGMTQRGTLSHPDEWSSIRRSIVVDDVVYTVSDSGIAANDLGDLDEIAWMSF